MNMSEELSRPETATTGPALRLEGYVEALFAGEDELLQELRAETVRGGFPVIHVPLVTARALQVLLRVAGARNVLEVGTLTGYSAVWMGRALPEDSRLLTLEARADAAAMARSYLDRAGLAPVVSVREGRAEEVLPELGPAGGWDAIFLDADKEGMVAYADEAARLLRSGGLLLADNTLWKGRVVEEDGEEPPDADTRAVRAFNRRMAEDERYTGTILPVGDGLFVGVRR